MLPDDHERQLWQQCQTQFEPYQAARLLVEALYIAAKQDKQSTVAAYLEAQLQAGTLTLLGLQRHFHLTQSSGCPQMRFEQHPLSPYDQLLTYACPIDKCKCHPTVAAQISQTLPHSTAVAVL